MYMRGYGGGIFLLHFPSACAAWTLSSTVPWAVRTFLTGIGGCPPKPARSPLQPRLLFIILFNRVLCSEGEEWSRVRGERFEKQVMDQDLLANIPLFTKLNASELAELTGLL